MPPNPNPLLAYTLIYVRDVTKSVAFYANAFGYNVRRLDQSHKWVELESGQQKIAFTSLHQPDTDVVIGKVQIPKSANNQMQPVQVCFSYKDVIAAYKITMDDGATLVSLTEKNEWGQVVGYVRDIDGPSPIGELLCIIKFREGVFYLYIYHGQSSLLILLFAEVWRRVGML